MNQQDHDKRSLAMHVYMANKIRENPSLFEVVKNNLERWALVMSNGSLYYLNRWRDLASDMDKCLKTATEDSEDANSLRQSSPFAGVMTPKERSAFLREWRNAKRGS